MSNNIRLIRKLLGDTQGEFAERFTKVTLGMQKSYETGGASPSALYVNELSEISGVAEKELMGMALRKGDIKLDKKVNDEESSTTKTDITSEHFTADQLFHMYMKAMERQDGIMEIQTGILRNIEDKMARKEPLGQVEISLRKVAGDVTKLVERQETAIKEFRGQFSILKAGKNAPSKGVRKKAGRSDHDQ